MEIKDEEFIKAINGAVEDIPQEVKIELVTEALRTYLSNPDTMKTILFDVQSGYYSSEKKYTPNKILCDIMSSGPVKDYVNELQRTILTYIKENMGDIIFKAIAASFAKNLVTDEFRSIMTSEMYNVVTSNVKSHEYNVHNIRG